MPNTIGSAPLPMKPALNMLSMNVVAAKAARPSGAGSDVIGSILIGLPSVPRLGAPLLVLRAVGASRTVPASISLPPNGMKSGSTSSAYPGNGAMNKPTLTSPAIDLDYDCVALAAAGADRGHAEPAAAAAQLVHE